MAPPDAYAGTPVTVGRGLVVTWEMNPRREKPKPSRYEAEPASKKPSSHSHVELLFRVALAILFVGCLSMVLGVTLLVENMQSTERRTTVGTRLAREGGDDTPAPLVFSDSVQEQCYKERDHGLIDVLRTSGHKFCGSNEDGNLTTVTLFNVPGRFRATLFSSLSLDLSSTRVSHPIRSMAGDGGNHDPRFVFAPHMIQCQCPELEQHALSRRRMDTHPRTKKQVEVADPLRLWDPTLANVDSHADHQSTICSLSKAPAPVRAPGRNKRWWGGEFKARKNTQRKTEMPTVHEPPKPLSSMNVTDRVVLIARKDDHNPFFQIAGALNAWIMMKALDWDPTETQLVHLDEGYPSAIDTLQQKLLSPNRPIISGKELKEKLVNFQSQVMLPPFESDGPMMLDLDNDNPCFGSALIQDFRLAALQALDVSSDSRSLKLTKANPLIVTVITRKPYGGRRVQRVWRNEDGVLAFMRKSYANKSIVFRSVECADLSLQQQMQLMVESDVVIGMHGAGMANVLWTRPETLVLEIFPKKRKRWGYRNLCQNLGCTYRDFRGGIDISTGKDDNANDKHIPPEEFLAFFAPLLTQHLKTQGRSL